jgi:hypothetical protein
MTKPKKDNDDYYELQILGKAWSAGYYAASYREAIHDFLNDPTYNLPDGIYKIEVRGKGIHIAKKDTKQKTTVTFQ